MSSICGQHVGSDNTFTREENHIKDSLMKDLKHPALDTISKSDVFSPDKEVTDKIGQELLKLSDIAQGAAMELLIKLTQATDDVAAATTVRHTVTSGRLDIDTLRTEVFALLERIDNTENETEKAILLFGLSQLLHVQGVKFKGNTEIM